MKLRHVLAGLLIGCVICLGGLLWVCFLQYEGDYRIDLPHGYYLSRVYAGAVMLCDPGSTVIISQNIDGYAVCQAMIIGHVSSKGLPASDADMSKPGYFVVDLKSGSVKQALSYSGWLGVLGRHGIPSPPKLHEPSPPEK